MALANGRGTTTTMTSRRKHSRYLLNEPLDGTLRVREEVAIERWSGTEIVVLSAAPSRVAETLTLEFPDGSPRHVAVTVEESRPVVAADGSLRHRLRLQVTSSDGNGNGRRNS